MKKILLSMLIFATAIAANAQIQRKVVIEEMTGTGCGWCPRGLAGMDLIKSVYEDKAVGIALHQYNSDDPMYFIKYANLGLNGAPSCAIDRKNVIDPYYGIGEEERGILTAIDIYGAEETHACVEAISATYVDDNRKKVEIKATVNFDADGDYSVAFVLTADSLQGTSNAWLQHNYYPSYSASGDELIDQFCAGGEYGSSTFSWKFNDVAIASSYKSTGENLAEALAPAVAGVAQEVAYTLSLPTKSTMVNAVNKDLVNGIVIIVDNTTGYVANAANVHVENAGDADGIVSATNSNAAPVAFYNAEGKAISAPQKGMNIVKMSDGSVKKIMY